ncbi:anti-sigma factor family protein [Guptibacillus hwajinpoensis]|uniref:Zinc-finger domain-containing protein n=1 Tax=Guptibacillus hwajinpoensis TaxID=208199 RepID=A0A0J6CSA2_9BACL|nr:hypothetical protein [Alkalihalobacillus macyae]KMM39156.1 hypothetical protein AB986_07985 [Alkalihalobacillus macyae]
MNHHSLEEWKQYASGELHPENRTAYDHHLDHCDDCLTLYMNAIEATEDELPEIENPSLYTDDLMSQLPFESVETISVKKKWFENRAFHYVLAAAMTFLLMTTGVFSQLTTVPKEFELNERSSFTEDVLNKTTSLLDRVEEEK